LIKKREREREWDREGVCARVHIMCVFVSGCVCVCERESVCVSVHLVCLCVCVCMREIDRETFRVSGIDREESCCVWGGYGQ